MTTANSCEAININATSNFFRAYCDDMGVRVQTSPYYKCPACNRKGDIFMPPPSIMGFTSFWGSAYHEAGHLDPTIKWTMDFLDEISNPVEHAVYNILIDHISERNRHGYYRGRDQFIYQSRFNILSEIGYSYEQAAAIDPLPTALFAVDNMSRNWQGVYPTIPFPKSLKGLTEEILKLDIELELESILETHDKPRLRALAHKILALANSEESEETGKGSAEGDPSVTDDTTPSQPNDTEEPNDDEEAEDDSSGDAGDSGDTTPSGSDGDNDSGDSDDPADGDSGSGDEEGDSGDGEPVVSDGSREQGSGYSTQEASKLLELLGINDNPSVLEKPEQDYGHNPTYVPVQEVNWVNASNDPDHEEYEDWIEAISRIYGNSKVSKEIQKHLQCLTQTRYQHGLKKGRISAKSMHRVYSGSSSARPNIFKRKQISSINTDTAVTLLIDQSGSMYGRELCIAAACGVALSSTLRDIRVPCEVLGFTDDVGEIWMYIYKSFAEIGVTDDTLTRRFSKAANGHTCYNADGESLILAAERLMLQSQKNKIMIVLSDGQPSGSGRGNASWYLKQVTKLIEDESPIKLYGIGIASTIVEKFYKNNCVINSPEELDEVLLPLMMESVLRK